MKCQTWLKLNFVQNAHHQEVRQRSDDIRREKREFGKLGRACGGAHTLQCEPAREEPTTEIAFQRGRSATPSRQTGSSRPSTKRAQTAKLRPATGRR